MPKRGQRLPFRVHYKHPPSERNQWKGVEGTEVRATAEDAAVIATALSRNGASGSVVNRDTGETIATFTAQKPEESDV